MQHLLAFQLLTEEADLIFNPLQSGYDLSLVFIQHGFAYLALAPQEVLSFGNISEPFSELAWVGIYMTLFLLCSLFLLAHNIYHGLKCSFVPEEHSNLNFFIYGFCKLTEPDPLPWFKGTMGGTMLVTLWSFFSLFILMFYQSNLRAYMVTVDYEKPLLTLQDVLDSGKKIWMINLGPG